MKKKILLISYSLEPPGGGSSVAAWALQALCKRYDVTVLTWRQNRADIINRSYGTSLAQEDCHWMTLNWWLTCVIDLTPFRLALLSMNVVFRKAKALVRVHDYDAVLSLINECDIGTTVIQYIHYPWAKFPRPDAEYRWYHFSAPLRLYRWACAEISGYREDNVRKNITLVNSDWTGRVFETYYGVPGQTVYPPVPAQFPDVPFDSRENGFVCVGRIARDKELTKLIEILNRIRQRGHSIMFHIVGMVEKSDYLQEIQTAAAPHTEWVRFHFDMPRPEMTALIAQNRYGIHGMLGEHFGIAPAELQRGGCITFVPDDGGVVEIVDRDERVIYHSIDDAVDKIDRMLRDDDFRNMVVEDLQNRKDIFSETRFMEEIAAVVEKATS